MIPFIQTARELHLVSSADTYRAKHADAIAKLGAMGARYQLHKASAPVIARISCGQWLTECECGAGNATDPTWGIACCFGCGAVHDTVIFPDDWKAIEAALVGRLRPVNRNWLPGETVDRLIAETALHQPALDVAQKDVSQ